MEAARGGQIELSRSPGKRVRVPSCRRPGSGGASPMRPARAPSPISRLSGRARRRRKAGDSAKSRTLPVIGGSPAGPAPPPSWPTPPPGRDEIKRIADPPTSFSFPISAHRVSSPQSHARPLRFYSSSGNRQKAFEPPGYRYAPWPPRKSSPRHRIRTCTSSRNSAKTHELQTLRATDDRRTGSVLP
jgi:hypothetical protein